jgi:hypothetical protein
MTNKTVLFIILVFNLNAHAFDIKKTLTPSPISIAITIGEWLLKDEKKTYHIQIESIAKNSEQARNEAFRLAVEMAVGTLVVSEREIKNNEVASEQILKYSSGYIDNFSIISETEVAGKTKLIVDVWVGESKIADRLLNISRADGKIEGSRIAIQQLSLKKVKDDAAKLIELVANDFPYRAFDLDVGKSISKVNARDIVIDTPIKIKWNHHYLSSLIDALEKTKDGDARVVNNLRGHQLIISYRKYNGWLDYFASFSEIKPGLVLINNFIESNPLVRINFKDDKNSTLAFNCRQINPLNGVFQNDAKMILGEHSFDQLTGQFFAENTPYSHFAIYGDYVTSGKLRTIVEGNSELVAKMKTIEVEIVRKIDCDAEKDSFESDVEVKKWCRAHKGNNKTYCPIDTR